MNIKAISLFIKYSSLAYVLIYTLSNLNLKLEHYSYAFILFLFLINHIRYFQLNKNQPMIYLTSFIEIISITIFLMTTKLYSIVFFIPCIVDLCLLTNNKIKYTFILFAFISNILFNISVNNLDSLFLLGITLVLLVFIKNQLYLNKHKEELFDKLRTSESSLKKTNHELKLYSDSIEEISILKERNRISREIHDNVGHSLSTTIIQLSALEKLSDDKDTKEMILELRNFVKLSLDEVRSCINNLKPTTYSNYEDLFKIKELINDFTKFTNINVKLTTSKITWELSSKQSFIIYRIIQESLSNSAKHSNCSNINIFLTYTLDTLNLTISDDGGGCSIMKKGNGLKSITERVTELSGDVSFRSDKNGFTTKITCPKYIGGNKFEQNKNIIS